MRTAPLAKLLVTSLILLALTACSKSADSGKVKVGFILSTLQEERYAKDKKFFEDKVAALGGETLFASANNDDKQQLAKVENLLSMGVKVLVIQPVNSKTASSFVELAHKDGVKVIAYDRIINNAPLDLYVTQDSYLVGKLQAEAAAAATGGKGKYVLIRGEAGHSVANEISRGVTETLAKVPDITIVVNQAHANWSPDLAMKTVENALTVQKNDIQAVLSNNSGMANGAVQALVEQKLTGKVFVAGADADLTAIKNIVQGKQQFEVLKAWQPLAEAAAEAAMKMAKGEAVTSSEMVDGGGFQVPVINTPVFPVTKDNLEQQVFATGFHSKEAVMGGL
jgi:D-xylose transport system substrate-binding protein